MRRDLDIGYIFFFSMIQDPSQKVLSVRLSENPPLDEIDGIAFVDLGVCDGLLYRSRCQGHDELCHKREPLEAICKRSLCHRSCDSANPRMSDTGFDSAEGLSESEIADDVECQHVEPVDNIKVLVCRCETSNPVHEPIDDGLNQAFLFHQRAVGKSMRHGSAHMSMLRRVALADNGSVLVRKTPALVEVALDERAVAMPNTIDVFPRACCVEGQLVRRSSNHGT